jgi:phospholipid-binding lipoprotein MlaA
MMHPMLGAFALSAALLLGACAATPGEELGSIPPRSPVTPQEQAKVYPIDVWDPFEGFNRGIYRFNTHFDRWVFLPVVEGYEYVTPDPVERSVSNFFSNLSELRNGWNGALQGRGDVFGTALGRLMINSTLGVVGLFDPATALGYPQRPEDFGQTLGRWGVPAGPYLVLPVLGPSNARDATGVAGDTAASNLLPGVEDVNERVYFNAAVYALYFVDQRHRVGFRYYQSGSPFEYDLVRFLYTKKRELDIMK